MDVKRAKLIKLKAKTKMESIIVNVTWDFFLLYILTAIGDSLKADVIKRTNQYTSEGSTVTLTCKLNQTSMISWYGPPNRTLFTISETINTKLHQRNRLNVTGDYNLQIRNFSIEDEGEYQCTTVKSIMAVKVQITRPPRNMTINGNTQQSTINCNEKQKCSIMCSVDSGVPLENMTLTKGTETRNGGPGYIFMRFRTSRKDHKETVTCQAFNDKSNALELTALIHVNFLPNVDIINESPIKIKEGHKLTLNCISEPSYPTTNVTWTKINNSKSLDKTYIFTKKNIMKYDAGNYTCTVRNHVGIGRDTVEVIVEYAPDVVIGCNKNGGKIRLSCVAQGIPDRYHFSDWEHKSFYRDHIRYLSGKQGTNNSVSFIDIDIDGQSDRGFYICSVSNGIPDSTNSTFVSMEYRYNVSGKPYFVTENNETQYGIISSRAIIKVYFVSFPKPETVRCVKDTESVQNIAFDGTMIPVKDTIYTSTVRVQGYEATAEIPVTTADDFTTYTFTIENSIGSNSYIVNLTSANVPENPSDVTVVAKQQSIEVTWKPGFHGGYPQSFVIEVQTRDQVDWTQYDVGFATRTVIGGLEPYTDYNVRIFSKNMLGTSNVTDTVKIKTGKSFPFFIIYSFMGVLLVVTCTGFIIRLYCKKINAGSCKGERNGNPSIRNSQEQDADVSRNLESVCVYSTIDKRDKDVSKLVPNNAGSCATNAYGELIQGATPESKQTETRLGKRNGKDKKLLKDGYHLNYIKVHFDSKANRRRFIIHGLENKTHYADIDLSLKAEPLPSSESEEESSDDDNSVQNAEFDNDW